MKFYSLPLLLIYFFLSLSFSLFSISGQAQSPPRAKELSPIGLFDLKFYRPPNYQLKDLVFEVRVSNLKDTLKKKIDIQNLGDVHFKIYWLFPNLYRIEVNGLPKVFAHIRASLKAQIKSKLDYVIPVELATKFEGYKFSSKKKEGETHLTGIDESAKKSVREVRMIFNGEGQLRLLRTFSPSGSAIFNISMGPKSWSHNKWTINQMTIERLGQTGSAMEENKVKYISVQGLGFPKSIDVKIFNKISPSSPASRGKKKQELNYKITFSNYLVNKGIAEKIIKKGR